MRPFSRTLLTILVAIVVGGLAVGACLAALIPGTVQIATAHHYTADQVGNLKALAEPSTVYYSDGTTVMGTFGEQARDPITSIDQVPKMVQNAVIATEDRSFWSNDGIDLGGVFRAFLTNLTSGEIQQGGSTITQQLVKNRILTPKRDVNRKIKEIEDALRLNEKFSKDKILVEYLNTVYFGSGSYGIKAAAARFFPILDPGGIVRGKHLDELTIGEAALLAGVISNPEGYSPFTHQDLAIRRRADVLRGMVTEHYITQAQADAANAEQLPKVKPLPNPVQGHDFLQTEVLQDLLKNPALGATERERTDKVLKGGLKIYTTFDQNLQAMAEDATTNAKPQMGADWVSSLVSIDPNTGAVKAMVSGQDFAVDQTNIATSQYGRQTGSTFKVMTLASALENGYSPNDIVDGSAPCPVPGVFPGVSPSEYPTNSDGREGGPQTIAAATQNSVNCAFVRIATSVGYANVIATAHAMGIKKNNLEPILNLTLGTREQNTETMATVMATIAADGMHHDPYVVQKIVGPDGKVILDASNQPGDQAVPADVASCEQNVLRDVVTGGTGTNASVSGQQIFGKTGTTDDTTDAWFIGANPAGAGMQLATAVWFGNYRGNTPGAGFGGDSAAPVFRAFMTQALQDQPEASLPNPGPVCSRAASTVNENGGRGGAVLPAPVVPDLPAAPATPTTPTPTAPATTAPAATTPTTPATAPAAGGTGT